MFLDTKCDINQIPEQILCLLYMLHATQSAHKFYEVATLIIIQVMAK